MTEEHFLEFRVEPGDDIQLVLDHCQFVNVKYRINFASGVYSVPTLDVPDNVRLEGLNGVGITDQ